MTTRSSRRRIAKLSRFELAKRFLVDRLLTRLSGQHRRSGLPTLAAVHGDHIGRTIAVQGLYERDLLEALCGWVLERVLPDARQCRALDVGANIGNHSVYLARYFRDVVAFEPNPMVAPIFRANVLLNGLSDRVQLVESGLSDVAGELPFAVTPANLGGSSFTGAPTPGALLRPVSRGDDVLALLDDHGLRIGLIKLDVEGFERAAIEGLSETIERHGPLVVFESHVVAHTIAIRSRLAEFGYRWFYALEGRRPGGTRGWLDRMCGLLAGDRISITEIADFEPRYYPMLIASTKPCLDGDGVEG